MKQSIFILMLLLSSLFTVFSQAGTNNGSSQQKLMQLERDIIKAFIAGDSEKIKKSYANDFKGYVEGYMENKERIMQSVRPLTGVTVKDLQMNASVYQTSAVVNGFWEIKVENRKPLYRQFMDVFIQLNNEWKMVASQQHAIPVWDVRKLEDSEMVAVTPQSCETEPTSKSLNEDLSTLLRIKNNTSESITVYWINYEGKRDNDANHNIHHVAAGESSDVYTHVTHPFIAVGSNGKCYGIYEATTTASIAIIKD